MKKKVDNIKDIEAYFLKVEQEEIEKKAPKVTSNLKDTAQIKKLKKELESYRKRNSQLELQLDALSSEKLNNFNQRDSDDISKMFLGFDYDEFCDKETKKIVENLKEENKRLNKENKRLHKITDSQKSNAKEKILKKVSYDEVHKSIKERFSFLTDNSIIAISSAEYLYLNETHFQIDYSGAYVNYIKALEIELRRVYEMKHEKVTFGSLMKKLGQNSIFKTFVSKVEREGLVQVRNLAIHKRAVSKQECGKVRKLLLDDGWLDRISFLVQETFKDTTSREMFFQGRINERVGTLFLNNTNYNRYTTDQNIDILSTKRNLSGYIKKKGIAKLHNGEEFFIFK